MGHSIDQTTALTGVSAFTLRNWEKRYGFLRPERRANGFREYSDAQVALLKRIHELIVQGARIGDLASNIRRGHPLPELPTIEFDPRLYDEAVALYVSLGGYDQRAAEARIQALEARFTPSEMLDLLYHPLLSKIGRDWASGRASIAQEHYASAFIRLRLARYLATERPAADARRAATRILFATVNHEFHEGGLLLLAAHLRLQGWDAYYLGPGLPIEEIRLAVQAVRPALVCLSFTDPQILKDALPEMAALAPTTVCVGGFAAALYDRPDRLPAHVRMLTATGLDAARQIERLLEEAAPLSTRSS